MELELHQLDLRYEFLRVVSPRAERKLFASIGERGQIVPISVVPEKPLGEEHLQRYVLLDGFARVRVLRRLGQDTVRAMVWDVSELEALLLVRSLRSGEQETALEQAWLLAELAQRFDLDQEELARRFDRTQSWVSRRLALIRELPESVHEQIRRGRIVPHAAAKFLVPMARASRQDCERLARAIAGEGLSSRDIGELYTGWRDGSRITRERLIENPALFLRVRRSAEAAEGLDLREALLKEVSVIGVAIRRAKAWVRRGRGEELTQQDIKNLCGSFRAVGSELFRLIEFAENHKEESDAGAGHKDGDPRAA